MYDKDESGSIDADEFSMIMVNEFCRMDRPRGVLVDKATGKPWQIPLSGTAIIDIVYQCELPSSHDVCNDHGIESVLLAISEAKTVELKELIFEQSVTSPYFYLKAEQGQRLYDEIQGINRTAFDTIAALLPQLVDDENVCTFIDSNMTELGKLALRMRLGPLYNAYIGFPTGHYCIDLKIREQRQGGRRLAAIAGAEAKVCDAFELNTSQKGNNSNFRNEKLGTAQNINISSSWFAVCPSDGVLHFDYVSTTRPRQGSLPITPMRFVSLIAKLDFPGMASKVEECREEALRIIELKAVEATKEAEKLEQPTIIGNAEVLAISSEEGVPANVYFDMDLSHLVDLSSGSPREDLGMSLVSPQGKRNSIMRSGSVRIKESDASRAGNKSPKLRSGRMGSEKDKLSRGSSKAQVKTADSTVEEGGFDPSKVVFPYSKVITHPLTLNIVKDQYHEYMDTSHRYYDIYPQERQRDISRINYDPNRTPRTPDDMKLPPPPQKAVMPYFYPVVYRKLLEVVGIAL